MSTSATQGGHKKRDYAEGVSSDNRALSYRDKSSFTPDSDETTMLFVVVTWT